MNPRTNVSARTMSVRWVPELTGSASRTLGVWRVTGGTYAKEAIP